MFLSRVTDHTSGGGVRLVSFFKKQCGRFVVGTPPTISLRRFLAQTLAGGGVAKNRFKMAQKKLGQFSLDLECLSPERNSQLGNFCRKHCLLMLYKSRPRIWESKNMLVSCLANPVLPYVAKNWRFTSLSWEWGGVLRIGAGADMLQVHGKLVSSQMSPQVQQKADILGTENI